MAIRKSTVAGAGTPTLFDPKEKEIPYGFCRCGCGARTSICKTNCRCRDQVRGEPMRFLPGHSGAKSRAVAARTRGLKWCNACKTEKTIEEFGDWSGKQRKSADGRRGTCRICEKAKAKLYRSAHPHEVKAKAEKYNMLSVYGISREQYWAMHTAQGGLCAICGRPESCKHKDGRTRRLAVDHCHSTGRVRALLCAACNNGIGRFEENIENMRRAIAYLEDHRTAERSA